MECITQKVLERFVQDPPKLDDPFATKGLQMATEFSIYSNDNKILAILPWATIKTVVYKMINSDKSLTKYMVTRPPGAPRGNPLTLWLVSSLFGQNNLKDWNYAVPDPPHLQALNNFVETAKNLVSEWGATPVAAEVTLS